ncbi:hypothetical protein LINPERHAP1_LOCUS31696 [Linum perenne]
MGMVMNKDGGRGHGLLKKTSCLLNMSTSMVKEGGALFLNLQA